ncbi:MAG TPA: 2Fe-2S iron-sulfur cluster binding domain-containing protein [Pseudomonas xinjiangensis]|uniref:2Fe-2S iron-sulfur cluster binding domain-containing protein n=2 Tax=root TaxID=1 RepID=A0A7V1FRF0_9GAMM|nr:2Fe-2S iron-sulfur cluster binding domain-containing protein [Halopseudomonas xinjiangensis]HEC48072.1 2Fe-2S iron-sulfur cluster binding domain-containing protein [Halopseudomonas xinjiangensis]
MPTVIFNFSDDRQQVVEAVAGLTLMQVAANHGLDGILGDCGGACQCATCHVYIDESWLEQLPEMDGMEDDMLEGVAAPRLAQSRLGCCVTVKAEHEGMVVTFPPTQI